MHFRRPARIDELPTSSTFFIGSLTRPHRRTHVNRERLSQRGFQVFGDTPKQKMVPFHRNVPMSL